MTEPLNRLWSFGHRNRRAVLIALHFALLVACLILLALDPNGALS